MKKNKFLGLTIIISMFLTACSVKSNNFPDKNIKIIVPYSAGGGVDITTRALVEAGKNHEKLNGKSFVVENVSGGGGAVGHTVAHKEKSDGYTVVAYTNALVNNPKLKEVPYETEDFKTLVMVCFDPEVLVVPKDSKFNSLEEFFDYSKENTIKVSTPGHSTSHHIAAATLADSENLKFEYLYNDGASIQMQQLMGGHCDAAFMSLGETMSQIKEGEIKALGVMSKERVDTLPEIPTFNENNVDLSLGAYRGFACKSDVEDENYKVLVEIFEDIARSEEFKNKLKELEMPYLFKDSEEFDVLVNESLKDIDKIKDILNKN